MTLFKRAFSLIASAMTKLTPQTLSASELRALSHEELLTYALANHCSDAEPTRVHGSKKRPLETSPLYQQPGKKRKEFDMSRYGQRLIALRIAYQGWQYHGFASQADSNNTVEHHLFTALLKTKLITSRQTSQYSRSGRTDVGVSAMGQVVGLQLRSSVAPPSIGGNELDYPNVINSCLPDGIRVLEWSPVSEGKEVKIYEGDPNYIQEYWKKVADGRVETDMQPRRSGEAFSARFDATFRSYKYFFVRGHLNIDAMQAAAQHFVGRHDFRNFCRIDTNVKNFERLLYCVEIRRMSDDSTCVTDNEYEMYYIFVKGQAFLWHQVRCMAAVLFDVGVEHEKPEIVRRMLEDVTNGQGQFATEKPQYRMASPTPLLLYECAYPNTVLHFPRVTPVLRPGRTKMTSFERADQKLALGFANAAAKAAVLNAVLRKNNESILKEGEITELKEMNVEKRKRNYLLDTNSGKHIPYHKRDS